MKDLVKAEFGTSEWVEEWAKKMGDPVFLAEALEDPDMEDRIKFGNTQGAHLWVILKQSAAKYIRAFAELQQELVALKEKYEPKDDNVTETEEACGS